MIRTVSNRYTLMLLVAAALTGAGIWLWTGVLDNNRATHSLWTIDKTNDRELAGAAHNIFFGQVIRESGSKTLFNWGPQTQFEVKVFEVLKGNLSGTVIVNQEAGYYEDGGEYHIEGEDGFLQEGKSYFFATRTSKHHDWHTVISYYGDVELDVPDDSDKDSVLSSDLAKKYRNRFTKAIENEVPYFFDQPPAED